MSVVLLTVIAAVVLLLDLGLIIFPGIPGIPVLWAVLALDYWVFGLLSLSGTTLFLLLAAAAFTVIADYVATLMGVKKRGGSTLGAIGSVAGSIIGLAVLQLPGMLVGCFLGALAGELLHGKRLPTASHIAVGALLGYAVSMVLQFGIWGVFAFVVFYHIYT